MIKAREKFAISAPRYEPGGWMHWPEFEAHSTQFLRLLGGAQEGASSVSECFRTATLIKPGNDESWLREWRQLAHKVNERGDRAAALGHRETANHNWLRALNYFRAAQCFLRVADKQRLELAEMMEKCARSYIANITPKGELVEVPHEGHFLAAYFLRASTSLIGSPVVICFGGLQESKEDQLLKLSNYALNRGLSLLLVDLPGQGATLSRNKLAVRHDQEIAIRNCVDYLFERSDIDKKRIVVYGEGLGGTFASRAASIDNRFAAAVCDGGIWDRNERQFVKDWLSDRPCASDLNRFAYNIATKMKCPFLVTVGEHDYLESNDVIGLQVYCLGAGIEMDVRIFSEEETGASHCQHDNPTIGKDFIFDWIASKVGLRKTAAHRSEKGREAASVLQVASLI